MEKGNTLSTRPAYFSSHPWNSVSAHVDSNHIHDFQLFFCLFYPLAWIFETKNPLENFLQYLGYCHLESCDSLELNSM